MWHAKQVLVAVVSLTMLVAISTLAVIQRSSAQELPGARDPQAQAAYAAGTEQMGQENWSAAIEEFAKAIRLDETYPEAHVGRAEALRELEDYSSAVTSYRQAINILEAAGPSPLLAIAYNGRGVSNRELGLTDLALSDLSSAIEMDRNNPEIAANYGDILVNRAGDPTGALLHLDKAIELDPENAQAFRNRGLAHAQISEFDEAIEDLKQSIELDSTDYETYITLASIHLAQDEFEPAIEAYGQAIKNYKPEQSSDPEIYITGHLVRGDLQLKLALEEETTPDQRETLYQATIADADQVLEEFPDRFPESGKAHYLRGLALRLQGHFGVSIKSLTDAIQIVPAGEGARYLSEAYLKRGICWHYQGQDSLARGDFEQAAGINFEDPLPHLWIGFTHAQEGDYRAAIESYGKAIAKAPTFPTPYVNRGLAYMQLGEFKKAIDNFNEAIRNEPTEAEHFFKRGIAHMQLEEYQKAFDSFHHATLNDEQMAKAFRGAAEALKALGRDNLAEQYQNRAAALGTAG